jgi:hypothetical protein
MAGIISGDPRRRCFSAAFKPRMPATSAGISIQSNVMSRRYHETRLKQTPQK